MNGQCNCDYGKFRFSFCFHSLYVASHSNWGIIQRFLFVLKKANVVSARPENEWMENVNELCKAVRCQRHERVFSFFLDEYFGAKYF